MLSPVLVRDPSSFGLLEVRGGPFICLLGPQALLVILPDLSDLPELLFGVFASEPNSRWSLRRSWQDPAPALPVIERVPGKPGQSFKEFPRGHKTPPKILVDKGGRMSVIIRLILSVFLRSVGYLIRGSGSTGERMANPRAGQALNQTQGAKGRTGRET